MNFSSSNKNAFVFVVCGVKEHIETLNFSLKALKKFTKQDIIVVTDSKRNEEKIEHSIIIDVDTPKNFSNHQACIWLKTSLHKILPKGKLYCYLDSDVIALDSNCDNIFKYFVPPIIFAKDHTSLSYFSPYAVNCDCKTNYDKTKTIFETNISKVIIDTNFPPNYNIKELRHLFLVQNRIRSNFLKLIIFIIKALISIFIGKIKIKNAVIFNYKKKQWEVNGCFYYPVLFLYRKTIQKNTDYRYNFLKLQWTKNNKPAISPNYCNHLHDALKETFNIIVPRNWQHWNGGVFIFNDSSYDFMEQWHNNTIKIFENNYWKIRDQGTLIATVFQMNLQKHVTLPSEFNFIADFYNVDIYPNPKKRNQFVNGNKCIYPSFIHVYHHFGDDNWDVWQRIVEILEMPT